MSAANAVYAPRVAYTKVYPDGSRLNLTSDLSGWLDSRQWLVDTLLHGDPVGTVVVDLRQVNRRGEDFKNQPAILKAPAPTPHDFHVRASKVLGRVMGRLTAEDAANEQETAVDEIPGVKRTTAFDRLAKEIDPAKVLTASYVPADDDEDPEDVYPGVRAYRPPPPTAGGVIPPPTMEVPDPNFVDEPVGDPKDKKVVRRNVAADE